MRQEAASQEKAPFWADTSEGKALPVGSCLLQETPFGEAKDAPSLRRIEAHTGLRTPHLLGWHLLFAAAPGESKFHEAGAGGFPAMQAQYGV